MPVHTTGAGHAYYRMHTHLLHLLGRAVLSTLHQPAPALLLRPPPQHLPPLCNHDMGTTTSATNAASAASVMPAIAPDDMPLCCIST